MFRHCVFHSISRSIRGAATGFGIRSGGFRRHDWTRHEGSSLRLAQALVIAATVTCLFTLAGLAQAPNGTQRDALFDQMMANPGDVETALAYAALSRKAGDLEAAVSTLERLKIFAPESAVVKFQLGSLYYSLGAYEVSKSYFEAIQNDPGLDAARRDQIPLYLQAIANRQNPDQMVARITTGIRYQTNATAGSTNNTVELYGIPFTLSSSARAQTDASAFVSGIVHLSHDLENQGDRLEADLSGYAAYYGNLHVLNGVQGQLRAGPVLNLARFGINHADLRLDAIAGIGELDGALYQHSLGVGATLDVHLDSMTRGVVRLETKHQSYHNSIQRPSIASKSGWITTGSARIERQISDMFTAYAQLDGQRHAAKTGADSYWQGTGLIGTRFSFGGPGDADGQDWQLELSAGLSHSVYDDNEPIFGADVRRDWGVNTSAQLTVPLSDSVSAFTNLSYRKVISTYGLHTFDDISSTLGISTTF